MIDLRLFYSPEERAKLSEQQKRAIELCQRRRCPCCGERLTLWEAFSIVFGSGVPYDVLVVDSDGDLRAVRERDVSPQTMYLEAPGDAKVAMKRGYDPFRRGHEF